MIRKLPYDNTKSDYVLIALLIVFSGNPIVRFLDKSTMAILSILILVIKYKHFRKDFFLKFFVIASGLLILFMLQNITLHFVSWLGAFRFISTFLFGGMIFYLVAERFSFKAFIVMYYISAISLFLFVVINLLNVHLPGLTFGFESTTYVIYTFVEKHHYRNCGMFWEPGAFAGILTLCIAINAKQLPLLWKNHRGKSLVIITALLTTKSTTGYLVFFAIVIYFLVFFLKNKLIKFALVPMLVFVGVTVYETTDFLKEKIEEQSERTSNLIRGEFSNSRFGSFKLDLPYIKKHPFIGNGLNPVTRYADDPLLKQKMQAGDSLGNANGFSNFLACLGIPFMFFYLLVTFSTISKVDTKMAFLIIMVILLTLWGEQWLYYPMFTGILFINIRPQQEYRTLKGPSQRFNYTLKSKVYR